MKQFNFRVVVCRIRSLPTLNSKIKWFWSELPFNMYKSFPVIAWNSFFFIFQNLGTWILIELILEGTTAKNGYFLLTRQDNEKAQQLKLWSALPKDFDKNGNRTSGLYFLIKIRVPMWFYVLKTMPYKWF